MRLLNLLIVLTIGLVISCKNHNQNGADGKKDIQVPLNKCAQNSQKIEFKILKEKLSTCFNTWEASVRPLIRDEVETGGVNVIISFMYGALVPRCLDSKDPVILKKVFVTFFDMFENRSDEEQLKGLTCEIFR